MQTLTKNRSSDFKLIEYLTSSRLNSKVPLGLTLMSRIKCRNPQRNESVTICFCAKIITHLALPKTNHRVEFDHFYDISDGIFAQIDRNQLICEQSIRYKDEEKWRTKPWFVGWW